ncbi:MAG: hypothetical protein ABL868_05500 [Sulfuriferula sp.]
MSPPRDTVINNPLLGEDETMLRNLMDRGYFSAIAASFNPPIKWGALKRAPYVKH